MKSVVLVVPCYNEAERLDVLAFTEASGSLPQLSFLFVDDGSRDETRSILERLIEQLPAGRSRLLTLTENVGKAEAVRRGVMEVLDSGEQMAGPFAVGYWDADLSTPLSEVEPLMRVLESSPETLAVLGSRVKLLGWDIRRRATRHYAGRVFATLASLALRLPVYDTQCGAKIFRAGEETREVFSRRFDARWAFDVEMLARFASSQGREMGARRIVVEHPLRQWTDIPGSKVKIRDLPRMMRDVLKVRLRY